MHKINTKDITEELWVSPKGKFGTADRNISIALGRDPASTDLAKRQPFDVEICRIPAGKSVCPYHSHSAQWEFYHILSGTGTARDRDGQAPVGPGDAFIYGPGEAHQLTAGSEDLLMYVVADNPLGEVCYYPDSKKWLVRLPERTIIRSESLDYHDGEE